MYTSSQWAMHEGMTHVQCTQKHLPCPCHCKHQMNTFNRRGRTTKSQRSSWGATIEVLCNNPGSNPLTAFVSCNPPWLDQTKVRNSLLHIVQFWLGDDAASLAVFQVPNLLLHTIETLFQVKLLYTLVIYDAIWFPNQDILTSKTHLHKILLIASIETNRVKRTRKHLRRCCRSKRRWTFKCTQTRNQHRFTTTNPKPVKIHVCLKQFLRIFTDLSFQLFAVGLSFPFKPSSVFNLCFRLSSSGLRYWYHFIIIDLLHWYLNMGHYYRALRGEFRFNTSFLSPLFFKLRKTLLTCLIVPNTRCFHATLTCWTSTSRFKVWYVRWSSFRTLRTTNSVSAGDVRNEVKQTLETALLELPVKSRQHSILLMALAKRNSPDFFFTLLDSGKTSLGCEGAGKLWPFNFRNSSGGSWLMSAGAVPLSFTIWGLLSTVPLSNCVKTPCPEFKSHLKGEIALMFLATKRINSALPSTRMKPCTTGPRSNPMWMKVHSTFLVQSGQCWRIQSGISARTWAPNKVQTGLDNFLPETISNGLLSEPLDVEKWLLHKAKYVKTSTKFSCENVTSNPCAFKSARKTENASFNSLTVLSAAPTERCCCGAARRMENV